MEKGSQTIAAISTPVGVSGIGIIRVSGPAALAIASKVIKTNIDLLKYSNFTSRKIIHAFLIDKENEILDEVLLSIMPAGKSYTGEFTIEINCHGGPAVLHAALERVLEAGARLADAGEFTRRALENGRLDLVQAEAINDLIHAKTQTAMKIARRQVEGGISTKCEELKNALIDLLSNFRAMIDFEQDQENFITALISGLEKIDRELSNLLANAVIGKMMSRGCWVVLTGPANSGKSSIFNSILRTERAIVSELPGTTRDAVSESIDYKGIEIKLFDTAGIRESSDHVEKEAMERSKESSNSADFILFVLDQSQEISLADIQNAEKITQGNGILILNKCDLMISSSAAQLLIKGNHDEIIQVSAKTGYQIENILENIHRKINKNIPSQADPIITNIRQIELINKAKEVVNNAQEMVIQKTELDIIESEIKPAIGYLEEILGQISDDEILDNIFKRFCIGK